MATHELGHAGGRKSARGYVNVSEDKHVEHYASLARDAREQDARGVVHVHIVSYIAQTLMGSVERRGSAWPNTWPRGSEERASQGQRSCGNARAVDAGDAGEANGLRSRSRGQNSWPCGCA